MPRIACLHTAESNIAIFEAALLELELEFAEHVALLHTVRADLLAEAERFGGLTPDIERRTAEALWMLGQGADAVILTCSTLGPSVDHVAARSRSIPILRVDAALAREAVADGGDVVVLCAAETTLRPTRALFETAAATTGAKVDIRLVPGAWSAFKSADAKRYLALVAEAVDEATRNGASRIALAQASMAGATKFVTTSLRPLTSPVAGLRAAVSQIFSSDLSEPGKNGDASAS